ncbi:VCBS repeat-containing protein [Polaribacter aestuariivivens]|uniref:VCBS repeat-containing protein n=1 Tax=Polaribacter aestuariivivens TaxID=2304626 RepID=UPI003F49A31F
MNKFQKLLLLLLCCVFLYNCNKNEKETTKYLFNNISAKNSGVDFKNLLKEDSKHSIINYIYFYNGAGVSAGDINNDGLPDLYFVSNQGENKLYLNKGNLQFEDISKKANINSSSDWNTGVTMVDINNDGFLDIYVCAVSGLLDFKGKNELFINNGDNTFTEKAAEYGLDFSGFSTQAYFFDYDKDNDLDVYIVNHATHTVTSHGKASLRNKRVTLVGDVLLKNDNGKFTDVSEEANIFGGVNGYGLSASIADFNNDGWDDIYVCNDFHEDDYYYINNQDGTFREELKESFSTISRFSMGSDVADINGDGFQDLITLDMLPSDERVLKETEGDDAMYNMQEKLRKQGYKDQYSRNMLQINEKGNYFYETALLNGVADTDWSWSPLFADFDNDGHQDLFISNGIKRRPNSLDFKKYVSSSFKQKGQKEGLLWLFKSINEMPNGDVSNEIFKGNSEIFEKKTGNWIEQKPSLSNGAIYADLDLDGDLDIITNNLDSYASIYENTTNNKKNSISLVFNYKKGNKKGIGTKAIIYNNGKKQLKQLFTSRGFISSVEQKLHFGLDTVSNIDSIKIIWPDNTFQKIKNPEINKTISVAYVDENPIKKYTLNEKSPVFTPNNAINFNHKEDSYYDFNREKIIPYQVSKLGPAVAIGDVDGNGYDDIYLGNSSGNAAELYLNNGNSFKKSIQKQFEKDANYEDNDAVFLDSDNDGDLDLYVATGIHKNRNRNLEVDRLYINENGKFKKTENKTLLNPLNTSCVAAYDYDNDGDEDLFIGNLSNPVSFGSNVNSAILVNDGNGKFKADLNFKLNAKVTNATWVDINNDNQKDLLIATEWGKPNIFINKNGQLSLLQISDNLNGLWQSITAFDVDRDGDKDILLGNWGLNTKFNPTPENPLTLYYGDFDKNNKKETIIAYSKNGKEYPVNSKDEMASQMNIISKQFVEHKNYALKTVNQIFSADVLNDAKKFTVNTLASGYLENNNGTFDNFKEFPKELQTAPITNFNSITINGENGIIVSGNSLRVNTYHGGYTSLKGVFLKSISDFNFISDFGILPFNSQVKSVNSISMKNENLLLVISNNDSLKTYSYKK